MDRLIPQEWFTDQPQWLLLLLSVFAMLGLIKAADMLVDGVAGVAHRLKVSKIVIAATILSLGTTSPEVAVSVQAALSGNASLALGNAIGSVICNAALIFGLGCLIGPIVVDRFVVRRQGSWLVGGVVLVSVPVFGLWLFSSEPAAVPRVMGILLLVGLAAYLIQSMRWSRAIPRSLAPDQPSGEPGEDKHKSLGALILISILGLLIVLPASRIFVASMIELARQWGIPEVLVAATLVSIGTSLPELMISLASVRKGHGEVLIGNVIGANILNLLFVIGASATVAPLPLADPSSTHPDVLVLLHIPFMILTVAVFLLCVGWIGRRQRSHPLLGAIMLGIYVAYVGTQFVLR